MTKKSNRGGARPGAGRPRKKNKDQRVSIQIPPDLLSVIDKIAQSQGVSRSAMIVWILRFSIQISPELSRAKEKNVYR